MTGVLAEAIQRTSWHFAAAVLLGVLSLLVLVVIVVEIAVWRRFKELKEMYSTAILHGRSFDLAFSALRHADETSSDRIDRLTGEVERIDREVHRLATFHPPGAAHDSPR